MADCLHAHPDVELADDFIVQASDWILRKNLYFRKYSHFKIIIKDNKISRQALGTIYDLVWEGEFKNMLNVGRLWLKFKEENKPFGISLRDKRNS